MSVLSSPASAAITPFTDPHQIHEMPVLVLLAHNRCNCHCVMCDIWRIRQVREITASDLLPHLAAMRELGVRHVAISGGEAQLHSDLRALLVLLRAEGIRITLLTAGLLLESDAETIANGVDDVIVSLDGPPEIHDHIRRVPQAFAKLQRGIEALKKLRPGMPVSARSTVQKLNFGYLGQTVEAAKSLRLDSISFLPSDLTSDAFNRPDGWDQARQAKIALELADVRRLEDEMERFIAEYRTEISGKFIVESPEKLRRIVRHFRAHLGLEAPVAPLCNAPWVSAVIESDGAVKPCFFHPPLGNIHDADLLQILNSPPATDFRRNLHVEQNPTCQRCVCSLYLEPRTQR